MKLQLLSRNAPQMLCGMTSIKNGCGKLYLSWFIIPLQGSPGPVGAPGLPGSTGNAVSCTYSALLMVFFKGALSRYLASLKAGRCLRIN